MLIVTQAHQVRMWILVKPFTNALFMEQHHHLTLELWISHLLAQLAIIKVTANQAVAVVHNKKINQIFI
jgi:hypothetical protein